MSRKIISAKSVAFILAMMVSFVLCLDSRANTSASDGTMVLASLLGLGSKAKTPAADFELPSLSGSSVRLSKFKGERPVLIYFWATWCPHCAAIRPAVLKLREKIGPAEMEVLAVNVGGTDSIERVKRYQNGHPVSWPVLYDGEGKVSRAYGVQGIPLFVLVNKEGIVVYRDTELPSDVRKYLQP